MSSRSGYKETASLDLLISLILIMIVAAYLSDPAVRFLLLTAAILLGLLAWLRFRAKTRALHVARGELRHQLEQNETRLNELISQIPCVVWEADLHPDGTLATSFISNYVEKMLGYSASEWIQTPHFWMNVIHNEDQARVTREISNIFHSGGGRTKFRWIAKDGHTVWVETHAAVTHDSHGVAKGLRGVTMDISARLYAEETLRDKEARLQIALSAALMKSWQWDLVSGSLMWDDTRTTWADFLGLVLMEDQPTLRNAVERVLQDRQTLDVEFRIAADEGIRWLTLKANVFSGEDGRPANITGVSVDITDRRKSAEALRASEERYRLAARASNDAIWDWDLATGEVQWNEGVRTLFGYAPAQVGSDIEWRLSQIHPDDRERVVSGINAVMKGGGRYWSDEYRFRCADGSYS